MQSFQRLSSEMKVRFPSLFTPQECVCQSFSCSYSYTLCDFTTWQTAGARNHCSQADARKRNTSRKSRSQRAGTAGSPSSPGKLCIPSCFGTPYSILTLSLLYPYSIPVLSALYPRVQMDGRHLWHLWQKWMRFERKCSRMQLLTQWSASKCAGILKISIRRSSNACSGSTRWIRSWLAPRLTLTKRTLKLRRSSSMQGMIWWALSRLRALSTATF